MNIEFERTLQDFIDFNLYHMAHSASARRQLLLSQGLTAILVVTFALSLSYALYGFISVVMIVIILLGGMGAFLVLPAINRRYVRSMAGKMLREGKNPGLLGHQWISLSPEGILSKNQTSETKYAWSAIDKVLQDDQHIYLYISSMSALVIPRNCFKSEAEKQEFLDTVNRYSQQK